MIILLEGPDGVGKSTLCGELIRRHAEEGRGGTATWNHRFWREHS